MNKFCIGCKQNFANSQNEILSYYKKFDIFIQNRFKSILTHLLIAISH